ncbi:GNAT family N-acetyltransferase [Brevibacillus sp. SYP-B805]|uniref:GNAT family N-acetyltransferase n=1 Tax=Brevibacillus sp. SYP-B805 TaxID=1578199 RepID=UPI0013ECE9EF|nr:GNAT family N-acetyltransferase [Brevibacillus sp. SYP-B805]NGQ95879.1 GNAT family N-acetyltransferase [Brevibacillus sp. SYP-B805]
MAITIRPASPHDLGAIHELWHTGEKGDGPAPPFSPTPPVFFTHELKTGDMYVAEHDGRILGFLSLLTRDSICYIAEFFVHRDHKDARIGGTLLREALPQDGRTICTFSSQDFRALSLYIRSRMTPLWPNFQLRVAPSDLATLPEHDVEIVETAPDDPRLLEWDSLVSRRSRTADLAYLTDQLDAVPLLFYRNNEPVGYAYVQFRSPGSLLFPEALTLGPIGARKAADAFHCACAAVAWAKHRGTMLRIPVPGPHPCLQPLLQAGFRITYVETFLSTAQDQLPDPTCYIPTITFF